MLMNFAQLIKEHVFMQISGKKVIEQGLLIVPDDFGKIINAVQ